MVWSPDKWRYAAVSCARSATRPEPSLPTTDRALGKLYVGLGRKQEAPNAYQRPLALNYEQPDVRQQVALFAWESGGARLAGVLAEDFKTRTIIGSAANVTNIPAVVMVMQLLDQGQYQQAEATCAEWIKLEPDNPLAYRLLGRACE